MLRKDMITILDSIMELLSDKKEYSIKSISYKLKSNWKTIEKSLEFLKKYDLVKEREGRDGYKTERLFSLK